MVELFRRSLAMRLEFQTLSVNQWTQHLLCAERYGEGRAFIAGDAARLVIPTGGLGMNTGAGDAIDLSWKLAGTLAGWGGARLLASYEQERRPIGLRNVKVSRAAMHGRLSWRAAYQPNVREETSEGAATRAEMARRFDVEQRKVTEILGIEAGYRYVDSPIYLARARRRSRPRWSQPMSPQAGPARASRTSGSPMAPLLMTIWVLAIRSCASAGTRADTAHLERALRSTGAPLERAQFLERRRPRNPRLRSAAGAARPARGLARQPIS